MAIPARIDAPATEAIYGVADENVSANGQVSPAVAHVLHGLHQRGLQQEEGNEGDQGGEKETEKAADLLQQSGDDPRDEIYDKCNREQMPGMRFVELPGLTNDTG